LEKKNLSAIIGCKFPCSLVEFIEMKEHLKEELEELEGEFERDEL
jgi:hypothetical protein